MADRLLKDPSPPGARTSSGLILGVETTCDETACAVFDTQQRRALSSVIATQYELHAPYAGVVPEIASRAHTQRIMPAIQAALREAGRELGDISAVAASDRPGLIGSLLVGVSAAKALAWSLGVPYIPVNHIHAHLLAALMPSDGTSQFEADRFPAIGLAVSGGHTALYAVHAPARIERLGATIDDALGEAFDKVATLLGLPHPGGPALERLASAGDPAAHDLPVSRLAKGSLDLSFSGLKTAALYAIRGTPKRGGVFERAHTDLSQRERADIAASFQWAASRAIELKLDRCFEQWAGPEPPRAVLAGGGVIANASIRRSIERVAAHRGVPALLAAPELCTDNAAMIAHLASLLTVPDQAAALAMPPRATVDRA